MMTGKLLLVATIAASAFAFSAKNNAEPVVIITDEKIEVNFVKGLTQAQLDTIQMRLKEVGIAISYPKLEFKDGGLRAMEFEVIDPRGFSGSASTSFTWITRKPFGFLLDLREDSPSPFTVGYL